MRKSNNLDPNEFQPVYATSTDISTTGAFEEGDRLYVIEEGELREIEVRIHEVSRATFVDINKVLGKELRLLREEDGVFVHNSHFAFDRIRERNEARKFKQDRQPVDKFTEALLRYASVRIRASEDGNITFSKEFIECLKKMRVSECGNVYLTFTFKDRSHEEVSRVGQKFASELAKIKLINYDGYRKCHDLVVSNFRSAKQLFRFMLSNTKHDCPINKFEESVGSKGIHLKAHLEGISADKENGWKFTVSFIIR